jgi:hypothetical protein
VPRFVHGNVAFLPRPIPFGLDLGPGDAERRIVGAIPLLIANVMSARNAWRKFCAVDGFFALASTIACTCSRLIFATGLSPCSARKRSRMLPRLFCVASAKLAKAVEPKYSPTVAATVPAVTRFAPITIGAALLSAAA